MNVKDLNAEEITNFKYVLIRFYDGNDLGIVKRMCSMLPSTDNIRNSISIIDFPGKVYLLFDDKGKIIGDENRRPDVWYEKHLGVLLGIEEE